MMALRMQIYWKSPVSASNIKLTAMFLVRRQTIYSKETNIYTPKEKHTIGMILRKNCK
jgi:hypothetical protein